ncbi:MAG: nitrogenase component 1 [Lachnospiraceae bacterium]|nr:nitrogenase component 1 [Lachnospiraceae bacterium]
MKQAVGFISTYSSDEFGICSALYELGGMVVMHDASGCNSTYTTHDEPRWYEIDSMIFISAISEMEAVMGDDEKLIQDIIETAEQLQPAFIAIVGAPIPYMIGTDLEAIAMVVEGETGIPSFGFAANGMQNYTKGISMALEAITKRFCTEAFQKTEQISANILGATPLDFSLNGSVDSIKTWLLEHGIGVNSCFAMGSSLEEIQSASKAHVNLVISYGGLEAAKLLKERFDIPYVVGVPFGRRYADILANKLKNAVQTGQSRIATQKIHQNAKKRLALIGETVFATSLASAIELEYDLDVRVFVPLDTKAELLRDGDEWTSGEDDLNERLKDVDGVIADPLYRPLCGQLEFYPLPHEAFSGRIYDKENPDLINRDLRYREETSC